MMVAWDVITRHLRASGLRAALRPQHHRRRRQDHRQGQGRGDHGRRGGAQVHRRDERRLRGARPGAARPRAARDRAHRRGHRRSSAGSRRRASPTRSAATSTTRCRSFAAYGQLSGQSIDDLKAGARIEVGEQKHSPLDFALWKGGQAGRAVVAQPLGPGPPGLAHRVLGDGAPLSRRAVRHPRRRLRPDLPAPRERDRPVRGRVRRRQLRAPLDALGAADAAAGRRCRSRSGTSSPSARSPRPTISRRCACCSSASTTGAPVGFTLGRDDAGAAGLPGARRGRGAARLLLPDAGQAGGRRRRGDDTGPVAARGREDVVGFPGSHGRRLQHRRRHRPPLRSRSCWRTSCSTIRRRRAKDVRRRTLARLRRDLLKCGETLGIFQRDPGRVPAGAPRAAVRAAGDRCRRRRGADPGARRRARREGLRPGRRDPQDASRAADRADGRRRPARPGAWCELPRAPGRSCRRRRRWSGSTGTSGRSRRPSACRRAPLFTRSRSSLPTLKKARRLGRTWTASPVRGLRPWYSL